MTSTQRVLFRRLSPAGHMPTRATRGSVGYDLYSAVNQTISPGGRGVINTKVCVEIPPGLYGHIADRSGLASICGVMVAGGIIDQDYEGEIKVILFNHGENEFKVSKGMRIAQLLFARCSIVELIETLKRPSPQENEISQEEAETAASAINWKQEACKKEPGASGSSNSKRIRGQSGFGSSGLYGMNSEGRKESENADEAQLNISDSDNELNSLFATIDHAKMAELFSESGVTKGKKKGRPRKAGEN